MRRVEVAVVGAGVTGLSVAYFLRELGVEALVVERTGIAAEASGVQPGGVRQQWGTRVNCVLARESVAFYRDFESAARFDPCGYLFVAHSEELLDELRGNVVLQNEVGVPSRLVSPAEAIQRASSRACRSSRRRGTCSSASRSARGCSSRSSLRWSAASRRSSLRT